MVSAMRVKSPFSQSALFGFMWRIYDGAGRQGNRDVSPFCIPHFELAIRKHLAGITLTQLVRKLRGIP
jgi:hypothetical protein